MRVVGVQSDDFYPDVRNAGKTSLKLNVDPMTVFVVVRVF